MRIVIIGAGNAGRYLAATLCDLNHDVILIDSNPTPLTEIEAQQDILIIEGEGASPSVLEKAEISKADILVAVTNRDEVNIIACAYAAAAGVKHKVARIANTDFMDPNTKLNLANVGVDLAVSHKEECAREIFNILKLPGTLEVVDLVGGKAVAVGIKVSTTSPLIRSPLKDVPEQEMLDRIRFIAAIRGDELIIPNGDTQLLLGDDVYVVMQPEEVNPFIDWACPDHPRFDKVIIGGGGDLGLTLAHQLEKLDLQIVLIEENEARADLCSGELKRTLVIRGSLLDKESLNSAGIIGNTAFAAVTGSDENNIISCLLAEKEGVAFTLAQVTKPEYAPIINSLSLLDRAVSPHLSLTNAILHFVRGKHVQHAALLHNLPGELLEIELPASHKWVGKRIYEVKLPKGAIIATIRRGDTMHPASGKLILMAGDHLVIFATVDAVNQVEAKLTV